MTLSTIKDIPQCHFMHGGMITSVDHGRFINNTGQRILQAENVNVGISHSEFIDNDIIENIFDVIEPTLSDINQNEFINSTGFSILYVANTKMASIIRSVNLLVTLLQFYQLYLMESL